MKKILIINGPNLNLLHKRDHKIYGSDSLEKAQKNCQILAKELDFQVEFLQTNSESQIIDHIHRAIIDNFDGIIINPAAYSHSSIAIRDALEIFSNPKIEVHLSNIYQRESFRHFSYISQVVNAVISGLGIGVYTIALLAIKDLIKE